MTKRSPSIWAQLRASPFKALVVKAGKNRIQPLSSAEVEHLRTWEAEKFRQKV